MGNDNTLKKLNIGDMFMNVGVLNGDVNVTLINGNHTEEARSKLVSMFEKKQFNFDNDSRNLEVSYKKNEGKMYLLDKIKNALIEINCYTGKRTYLGQLVSSNTPNPSNDHHSHPSIPGCTTTTSHSHKGGKGEHQHSYNCRKPNSPTPYKAPREPSIQSYPSSTYRSTY